MYQLRLPKRAAMGSTPKKEMRLSPQWHLKSWSHALWKPEMPNKPKRKSDNYMAGWTLFINSSLRFYGCVYPNKMSLWILQFFKTNKKRNNDENYFYFYFFHRLGNKHTFIFIFFLGPPTQFLKNLSRKTDNKKMLALSHRFYYS